MTWRVPQTSAPARGEEEVTGVGEKGQAGRSGQAGRGGELPSLLPPLPNPRLILGQTLVKAGD